MENPCLLAVIQSDLPLICQLRAEWEETGRGTLRVARNAQEAVLYFRGVGVYGNREKYPIPNMVALDSCNSNGSDLEVLSWLRETAQFRNLPVALLCPEQHAVGETICALDSCCYLVDRLRLDELVKIGKVVPHSPAVEEYPAYWRRHAC